MSEGASLLADGSSHEGGSRRGIARPDVNPAATSLWGRLSLDQADKALRLCFRVSASAHLLGPNVSLALPRHNTGVRRLDG